MWWTAPAPGGAMVGAKPYVPLGACTSESKAGGRIIIETIMTP
jgi:hypothetical protein